MRALIFFFVAVCCVVLSPANAQDTDADQSPVCPVISPELAAKAAEEVKDTGKCEVICRGCGCKGGPGYRGPRGCVDWADLIRTCGPPPHGGCTRECAVVKQGCRGRQWLKAFAAGLGLAGGLSFAASELPDAEASGGSSRAGKRKRSRNADQEHIGRPEAEATRDTPDAGTSDDGAVATQPVEASKPNDDDADGNGKRGASPRTPRTPSPAGPGAASQRGHDAAPAR